MDDRRDGDPPYAAVARDGIRTGAVLSWTAVDRAAGNVPTGAELVIEVDDVQVDLDRIRQAGWPLNAPLERRPWGLTDFRVHDPDGYYLRITSRE